MTEKINFSLTNKIKQKVSRRDFLFVLEKFLKKMDIENPIEVNLILVGKNKIQNLNYTHRKKDKPTDVLSFPIDITSPVETNGRSSLPKKEPLILGDIYICPQMTRNQRNKESKKQDTEDLQNTFLHGLIHLIGYDHEKNEKEWERVLKKIEAK